jgi:NADPH:quinone reductase
MTSAALPAVTHHTRIVNGIRIHYLTAGSGGPALVLVHGFPETSHAWRKVIPVLAEHFTVIAPDLRGCGDSDRPDGSWDKRTAAEDIHALVQHLGFDTIDLAGHDVGMMVAYTYASAYPAELRHLVLMEAALPGLGLEELYDATRFPRMYHLPLFEAPNGFAELLISGREKQFIEHFMRQQTYDPTGPGQDAIEEYARRLAAPGALRGGIEYFRSHQVDAEHNRENAKMKLPMPVLTIGGTASFGERLEGQIKPLAAQVQSIMIDQCGHYLAEEQPGRVIDAFLNFLLPPEGSPEPLTRAGDPMSRIVVAAAFGGPEVLRVKQAGVAPPGRGEVSIKVRAAGVNPVDVKSYAGQEKGHDESKLPLRLGVEASGVVTAAGADARGPAGPVAIGDEVIAYRILGAYADTVTVPAGAVVPKPPGLSWETASAMMLTGTTAIHLLTATGVTDGDAVLIHGAAGGVGSIAAQIAVRDGARVIGTASEDQFDRLRSYGVIPVTYGEGLLDRVRSAAPHGVGAAIDTVGTDEAIDVSLALVSDRRRIATVVAFERSKGTGIKELGGSPGSDMGGIEIRNSARLRLTSLVAEGSVEIVMGPSFPLADVAEAHRQLAAGKIRGRVVLIP